MGLMNNLKLHKEIDDLKSLGICALSNGCPDLHSLNRLGKKIFFVMFQEQPNITTNLVN